MHGHSRGLIQPEPLKSQVSTAAETKAKPSTATTFYKLLIKSAIAK